MNNVEKPNVRDFEADRKICDAATAGDWEIDDVGVVICVSVDEQLRGMVVADSMFINDARFIAEARTGWPAALDEIERLQAENKRHEQRIEFLTEFIRNRPDVQRYRQALESLLSVFNGNYITKNKPSAHVDAAIQKAKEALSDGGN